MLKFIKAVFGAILQLPILATKYRVRLAKISMAVDTHTNTQKTDGHNLSFTPLLFLIISIAQVMAKQKQTKKGIAIHTHTYLYKLPSTF